MESLTPTYDALSPSDRALVDAYFACGMVQWRAYREAIYTGDGATEKGRAHCRQMSSRKFANVNIRRAISERLAERGMAADEAIARLAEHARADHADYFTEAGHVDLAGLIRDGKAHLIKEIDYKGKDADRQVVRFNASQPALRTILEVHGALGAKGTKDDPHYHHFTSDVEAEAALRTIVDAVKNGARSGH